MKFCGYEKPAEFGLPVLVSYFFALLGAKALIFISLRTYLDINERTSSSHLSTNVFRVKLFLFYFVPIPYFLSYTHPYSHTRKKPNTFVLSTNIQTNSFSLVAYAYHRTIRLVKFFSTHKVGWSNFTNCPNFYTRMAL